MGRKTERPDTDGCKNGRGIFPKRHDWRYSTAWNCTEAVPLAYALVRRSFARAGWRCYNCGRFAWDQSDREYMLGVYDALGLVQIGLSGEKALQVLEEPKKAMPIPSGAVSKCPGIMIMPDAIMKLPGEV